MNTARELELDAIRGMMRNEAGRDYFAKLLAEAHVNLDTFNADPIKHAHRAGSRLIGLRIQRDLIEADSDLYITMLKEHFPNE